MFEPIPGWYERLPSYEAMNRLQSEDLELWPDITDAERIGLGWSLLVGDREPEIWERARNVPGFRWSSVGLLHPEVDRDLPSDAPPFGVILYAQDGERDDSDRALHEPLQFDEIALPVVIRAGFYEDHAAPQPLHHGRLACWASSRHGRRTGWLTARHVADHPAMAGAGRVVDRAPECLDAALVQVGGAGGGQRQPLAMPVATGAVELDLKAPSTAQVIDVATNLGVRRSSRFPLRFSMNDAGVPGDSGSLIIGTPCGEPLGLYLGSFISNTGARCGIGLALSQIEYFMDLEVYA